MINPEYYLLKLQSWDMKISREEFDKVYPIILQQLDHKWQDPKSRKRITVLKETLNFSFESPSNNGLEPLINKALCINAGNAFLHLIYSKAPQELIFDNDVTAFEIDPHLQLCTVLICLEEMCKTKPPAQMYEQSNAFTSRPIPVQKMVRSITTYLILSGLLLLLLGWLRSLFDY